MGILEIRTTDTLDTPASNIILLTLGQGEDGILYLENPSLHEFHFCGVLTKFWPKNGFGSNHAFLQKQTIKKLK